MDSVHGRAPSLMAPRATHSASRVHEPCAQRMIVRLEQHHGWQREPEGLCRLEVNAATPGLPPPHAETVWCPLRLSTAVCDDVLRRHGLARRPCRRKGGFTQASAHCGQVAVIPDALAGRQGSTGRLAQGSLPRPGAVRRAPVAAAPPPPPPGPRGTRPGRACPRVPGAAPGSPHRAPSPCQSSPCACATVPRRLRASAMPHLNPMAVHRPRLSS